MKFNSRNKQLVIQILNKNAGKFRFKRREHRENFGQSFATRDKKFDKEVYLEWQIGYDLYIKDLEKGKKQTGLYKDIFKFIGANGKEKYPYELAEFLYLLIENRVLTIETFTQLKNEIKDYDKFLVTTPQVSQKDQITINGLKFNSAITKLPTYYYLNKDNTYIEVIIQKQQYAPSFQSMVYFCIPIMCFSNGQEMLGYTSKEKDIFLRYVMNIKNVLNLFRTLAMAGENHQKDVIEILRVLEKGFSK